MHWRSIESAPLPGAENMAHDEVLLEGVQAGGRPVLRFYRWAPACLSLGRNQVVARPQEVAAAVAARGFDLVRRATGGAAVLHDRELTYAVAVPVGVLGSPRETYVAINRALVAGLRRLGVAAEVAGGGRAEKGMGLVGRSGAPGASGASGGAGASGPPGAGGSGATAAGDAKSGKPIWNAPCFQAPAPGEVVAGGLKLVGSAQRREGRTLLQHGSLLLAGDQTVVAECLAGAPGLPGATADLPDAAAGLSDHAAGAGNPVGAANAIAPPPSGFTTLSALLDPLPTWSELVAALTIGFETTLDLRLQPDDLTVAERARIEPLTAHFRSPGWTWRR